MSGYDRNSIGFSGNLRRAIADKDWLSIVVLIVGVINIVLSFVSVFTGFTNGWLSIALGFVIAAAAMLALDKTKNSISIVGAICGFLGTGVGLIYLFCVL